MEARSITKPGTATALMTGMVITAGPKPIIEVGDEEVYTAETLSEVSPNTGDRVLLGFDASGTAIVLGIIANSHLRSVETGEPTPRRLSVDGASAGIEATSVDDEGSSEQRLVVRDNDDRVLFEFVPESSRCIVHAPSGDLVFSASRGRIELEASEGIHMSGGPLVDIEADAVRASAEEVEVTTAEIRVTADVLHGVYRRVRQRVDILETTAGRIMERAKESYRDVESLAQTRAGRVRMVAAKTFHVMGERTLFKAHHDVKINGEKIHLG